MEKAQRIEKNKYLVTRNPFTALLVFYIPILFGNLFQQFYNLVDSAILGQFVSEQALAAAGACLAFTNIFIFIGNGGGIGAGVIAGRYFGACEYRKMRTVISTSFIVFFALSIVLGITGFFTSHLVMSLLKTPEDTIGLATTYLKIYFVGLPFIFLYNLVSSLFNALGKSTYPLVFLIISSVLNIGLDLLFVTRFHFGIAGVAWATLIAQGFSFVLSAIFFLKELNLYKSADGEKDLNNRYGSGSINRNEGGIPAGNSLETVFDWNELGRISKIALPSIFQQATISIGLMLIQSTVNSFGSQALAGYSVGVRIESLGSTAVVGLGSAFSNYVAQNIGAGKLKRIHQGYLAANALDVIFALIFFILIAVFRDSIIYLFIGKDCSELAYETAKGFLVFMSEVLVLLGFKHSADGVMRGMGKMKIFTIGNVVNIALRVIFSKLMAPVIGIKAVWLSNPIGWITSMTMCYIAYRYEYGKMMKDAG